MKLSLVFLGILAITFSFIEAAEQEESRSLAEENNNIVENVIINRNKRSAGKISKRVNEKQKRQNENGTKKRYRKGKRSGQKVSKGKGKYKKLNKRKRKEKKVNEVRRKARKINKGQEKVTGRKVRGRGNASGRKIKKELDNKKDEASRKADRKMESRAVLLGSHCEYVDLCMVDRMAADGCHSGQKFVIKSPKGTRRQFLMVNGAKIIAFLKSGKKITDCGTNLTDITRRVSCKTVDGASDIKLVRQETTVSPDQEETMAAVDAETTKAMTDSMPPVGAGQIHCPCPERTCITTITSTNNNHEIKCGSKTFNVPCGGPLIGSKIGMIISIIEVFSHSLCSMNTYLTLIKDLVWKCNDLDIPEESICLGDATMAPPSDAPAPPSLAPALTIMTIEPSATESGTGSDATCPSKVIMDKCNVTNCQVICSNGVTPITDQSSENINGVSTNSFSLTINGGAPTGSTCEIDCDSSSLKATSTCSETDKMWNIPAEVSTKCGSSSLTGSDSSTEPGSAPSTESISESSIESNSESTAAADTGSSSSTCPSKVIMDKCNIANCQVICSNGVTPITDQSSENINGVSTNSFSLTINGGAPTGSTCEINCDSGSLKATSTCSETDKMWNIPTEVTAKCG